ncbi:c-type cytochrome [Croceibacterium aestuarii]|uniref:c-type cytochrome n=1 Tax=Croceibacterium aestuarii TaxID=3064139 RepID=UPI00272E5F54|nr:cytochrome c [Croceibacterium sp. D39]
MIRPAVLLALSLLALPFAAAGSDERWSPEQFYDARCAYCHDARGWGTRKLAERVPPGQAELRKRRGLPPAYVEYVVRHGAGSMPQFTPTELTDAQLAALAQWLAKEG